MAVNNHYQQSPIKRKYKSMNNYNQLQRKRGSWLWVGLSLTGVAMLSATAGALLAVSLSATPLKQAKLEPNEEAVFNQEETISFQSLNLPKLSRPVNILVLGTKVLTSDLDKSLDKELGYHALVNSLDGLSDTMLLLRFDPEDQTVNVLSIPRDTKVELPNKGETKINFANYHGGPALAAKTISNLLGGVTIDRYIRVNVQGVEKLINALGGVTVYVPKDMKYQDDSQHLYINLKKGKQHLDGNKSLQFLRFRYDRYGDIGRIQRQQMLMRAIVEQTLKPSVLVKAPKIFSVVQSHLDTNLTVEEFLALAGFAAKMERSKVQMLMLPGEFSGDGKKEVSYWIPHHRQIRRIMGKHFDLEDSWVATSKARNPAYVKIAIQDSLDDRLSVQAMVRHLQRLGYSRIYLSHDWQEPLEVTRIIAQQGDDATAVAMKNALGFGEVLVESTGSLSSDITIQLGKDWQWQTSNDELSTYGD